MKVINLKINGESFVASTYDRANDNIDAILSIGEDLIAIRATRFNDVGISLLTNPRIVSSETKELMEDIEDMDNLKDFLVSKYQEYLYPFFLPDSEKSLDIHKLLDWCSHSLDTDENIEIMLFNLDSSLTQIYQNHYKAWYL